MSEPDDNLVESDDEEWRRQHELDGLRIRQVARARQAATRAASYFTMAALACAVCAVDLLWRAVRLLTGFHQLFWPALYVLWAIAFICVIPWLWRCAIALRAEAQRKALPEPQTAPDFSTLSDGSQIVENLKKMN